jgi:hypothetical protein
VIIDALTESGSRYRIQLERGLWMKISHDGYRSGAERAWSMKVGTSLTRPWQHPEDWEDATKPVVGKHLYLASKDVWYVSTPIQKITEVSSWDAD